MATGLSIKAHEPTGSLREGCLRLDWSGCRGRIVMVEKRSLEPSMLGGQSPVPRTQAVVDYKDTQVLVGQKQQLASHRWAITLMPKRSLAVVAHIEQAVSGAQEARVGGVQRAMHLLHCAFFQDARLGDVFIAVAAVLKVRDHEARHVGDTGLV